MLTKKDRQRFERLSLPHLDAAYNLALWMLRNPAEAEDTVQIAFMRAFEAFNSFSGNNIAAWLMTIVRNTAINTLNRNKRNSNLVSFDEIAHNTEKPHINNHDLRPDEVMSLITKQTVIAELIERLPLDHREVLYLRDIEGYSYKEISEIILLPKGTVMSRLSRARAQLQKWLLQQQRKEHFRGL
ncbi:MAG: sigma-70 family RNA polymerase sigma factor [Gammaproteobacteria bacterium]|nr:sigma-70 family RNA polymerase sigma factor [Gammaproteobacteria bacterium]